jgi:flagellar biogenesis protein FliO
MRTYKIFLILNLGLLMFDSAIKVFLVFLVGVNSDIVIIKVDERSFLIGCKEMVFLLIISSFEGLDRTIIKGRRSQVSRAGVSALQMLFQ